MAVYEDGDSETMSMTQAKKWLQPEGMQLPAGVTVPDLAAQVEQVVAAAAVGAAGRFQELAGFSNQGGYPAISVSVQDMQLLNLILQCSMAQELADPITRSEQWKGLAAAKLKYFAGFSVSAPPSCVWLIAPALAYTARARVWRDLKGSGGTLNTWCSGKNVGLTSLRSAVRTLHRTG